MVKSKEELLNAIKAILPDDSGDDALALFEDLSDTLDENKNTDNEDWKNKYEENDKMWRERYRDRFFSGDNSLAQNEIEENIFPENEPEKNEPRNFDELFN